MWEDFTYGFDILGSFPTPCSANPKGCSLLPPNNTCMHAQKKSMIMHTKGLPTLSLSSLPFYSSLFSNHHISLLFRGHTRLKWKTLAYEIIVLAILLFILSFTCTWIDMKVHDDCFTVSITFLYLYGLVDYCVTSNISVWPCRLLLESNIVKIKLLIKCYLLFLLIFWSHSCIC